MAASNDPARVYIRLVLAHVMPGDSESEGVIALIDRWRHGARARGWALGGNGGSAEGAPPGPCNQGAVTAPELLFFRLT